MSFIGHGQSGRNSQELARQIPFYNIRHLIQPVLLAGTKSGEYPPRRKTPTKTPIRLF